MGKVIKITNWGPNPEKAVDVFIEMEVKGFKKRSDVLKFMYDNPLPTRIAFGLEENVKKFTDLTQKHCPGMQYIIEEEEDAVHKNIPRTELVENFLSAINNIRAAFDVILNQNDEVGDRYNKVCSEAMMLKAKLEKLEADNTKDLCIKLREEIACLTRDNGKLKETNNCLAETIEENEKTIDRLEKENSNLREGKKVVEAKNDNLVAANKSLEETIQGLNEVFKAVKNLVS